MRIHRPSRLLALITIFVALATLSACGSGSQASADTTAATAAPVVAAPAPAAAVNVTWDSGPLDLAYHNERIAIDLRHNQEIAHPRADESADKRVARQAEENKDLERRYTQGKADHKRELPPAERH